MTAAALTVPPKHGHPTFLFSELTLDLDTLQADIAILGIPPYGSAYAFEDVSNDQSRMPTAMRQASDRIVRSLERYDFDLGGPLYDGRNIRMVDCGDVRTDILDMKGHLGRAEQAVRKILKAGALPIILGGDHAIPIPVLRAFEGRGCRLRSSKSISTSIGAMPSTASGMDCPALSAVRPRWCTSARSSRSGCGQPEARAPEEFEAARAYGAHLISAYELHDAGMDAILGRIPAGEQYYITIDLDGMDPSEAPAVAAPIPGGVTFLEARKLIRGLVQKGRVVGMDLVEITPQHDVNHITCITAGRLIVNLIGTAVRAGYFDRS